MNRQQTTRTLSLGEVSGGEGKSKSGRKGAPQDILTISQQPHVLVVDDDRRLRLLLRDFLTENGFLVATAVDAADARGQLRYLDFDALVLDVMMPGESGIDLMRALRSRGDISILLLTAMDEVDDRIAGLEGGADDYLAKPFEPRELVLRLNAILRRAKKTVSSDGRVIRFGDFEFDQVRGELRRGEIMIQLTSGEVGLLRVFSRHAGTSVSREFLATRMGISSRSVDVQIARLRRKIEGNLRHPRYLLTIRGEGYVLRAD